MKVTLILIIAFALAGCGKTRILVPKNISDDKYARLQIFVLKDTGETKYFISDSIKTFFRKGQIGRSPLIAIDGIVLNYQKNSDTIILSLRKSEITDVAYLNKKSSQFIYGENAISGAVIINTIFLQNLNDTIRVSSEKRE